MEDTRSVLCDFLSERKKGGGKWRSEGDSHIKVFVPERIEGLLDGGRRKFLHSIERDNNEWIGESEQVPLW